MREYVPRVLVAALLAVTAVCLLGPPAGAVIPTCSITGPASGGRGEMLCFTAIATDPDGGSIVSYSWDWGGGARAYAGWSDQYEADVLPEDAGWDRYEHQDPIINLSEINPAGQWHLADYAGDKCKMGKYPADISAGVTVVGRYNFISGDSADNLFCPARIEGSLGNVNCRWDAINGRVRVNAAAETYHGSVPAATWTTLRITVDSAGNWNLYIDENATAVGSGTAGSTGDNRISIGAASTNQAGELRCDWVYTSTAGAYAPGTGPKAPGSAEGAEECATWDTLGTKTITLTVTDDGAETGTCTKSVEIQNALPTCSITFEPALIDVGTEVTFNANASDVDGTIASWSWDFGDGGSGTGDPATHIYASQATYTVTCTVTDNDAGVNTCSTSVTINVAPDCVITGPTMGNVLELLCWDGSDSSDPDGGSIVSYEWRFGDAPAPVSLVNPSFEDTPPGASPGCWTGSGWTVFGTVGGAPGVEKLYIQANEWWACGINTLWGTQFAAGETCQGETINGCYQYVASGFQIGANYTLVANIVGFDTSATQDHTTEYWELGFDPTGGTDPDAGSVVWGPQAYSPSCGFAEGVEVSAPFTASATDGTVFFRYHSRAWTCIGVHALDNLRIDTGESTATGNPGCHAYDEPGTYTVTLTVTDDEGSSSSCTTTVTIIGATCEITDISPADPSVEDTVTVTATYDAPGGDPVTADWTWGDALTSQTSGSGGTVQGTHQYAADGTYTITVLITDNGGYQGECVGTVTVVSPPVCVIDGPTTIKACKQYCYDGSQSYDPDNCGGVFPCPGQGIASYVWDFGGGGNRARNADFEGTYTDGLAQYWTGNIAQGSDITWTNWSLLMPGPLNEWGPHGGSECQLAWFSGDTSGQVDMTLHQVVSGLTPGSAYKVGGWIAMDDPGAADTQMQVGYDLDGGTNFTWLPAITGDGYWHEMSTPLVATGTSITVGYRWRTIAAPDTGTYYCYADDAMVTELQEGPSGCGIFREVGTAELCLTVTDDEGLSSTCCVTITVEAAVDPPTCSITYDASPFAGPVTHQPVTFHANAVDPDGGTVTCDWEFGDGTGVSADCDPVHTYDEVGFYTVTVTVADEEGYVNCAACTLEVEVTNPAPECTITVDPPDPGPDYCTYAPICFHGTGTDANGSVVSYGWDFGDSKDYTYLIGNPSFENDTIDPWVQTTGRSQPQATPGNGGDWTFCGYDALTGIRFFGDRSSWGPVNSRIYQQAVGVPLGILVTGHVWINSASWHNTEPIDRPENLHTRIGIDPTGGTDRDSGNVVWAEEDPPYQNCSVSPYVEVTVSAVTASETITVFCEIYNDNNLEWSLGVMDDVTLDGHGGASGADVCYTYDTAGTYTVTLTVVDDDGAIGTCTTTVTVVSCGEPPTCSIDSVVPSSPTTADTIEFTATVTDPDSTVFTYDWDFGDGTAHGTTNPATHQYADDGTYTVVLTVEDELGLTGTCETTVTVANVAPSCLISGPSVGGAGVEICFEDASTDPDGTIVSQVWDFGDAGPAPPDLVVLNPSFEDATAWTTYAGDGPPDAFGFCSYAARTGSSFYGSASNFGNVNDRAYQTLADAVPGASYRAHVWINSTSFWLDVDPEPDVGGDCPSNMHTRIGVDPDGGTDPNAVTVVWSDDTSNMVCGPGPYVEKTVDFVASTATPTIFVEGYSDTTCTGTGADYSWQISALDDVSVTGLGTGGGVGSPACHVYETEGTYTVTLTVTDDDGASSTCTHVITIGPATLDVTIPLSQGWHMISLPLEPVNKTVLVDRTTKVEDPDSIFYSAYVQGNDPRNRLFRMEPAVGYWVYNPDLYPTESWYEVGVEPPVGKPHPGPWWQGFWFYVEPTEGITLTYVAYPLPTDPMVRYLDINKNYTPGTFTWAWIMTGACAVVPSPHNADVTTWPLTSTVTDMSWGQSTPPTEPATWLPTSDCAVADAWDSGYIGLPLVGYTPGVGYYTVSPPSGQPYCGAPADSQYLTPGEGYWLDVEDPEVWLGM